MKILIIYEDEKYEGSYSFLNKYEAMKDTIKENDSMITLWDTRQNSRFRISFTYYGLKDKYSFIHPGLC